MIAKTLSLPEVLPIIDVLSASYIIPTEFIAFFRTKESPEAILEKIIERAEKQIITSILQEERYSLRGERKRPWARKTRRPFRGKMDREIPTFSDKLGLAEEVAIEVTAEFGQPWEKAGTGRPAIYDPVKLAATLLVKGCSSFTDLASELKNIGYDATLKNTGQTPCPSELHYAFSKTKSEWIDEALARLDERCAGLLEKFNEPLDHFVIDGSALTEEHLNERTIGMKKQLVRQIYSYTALMRLPTNTVRGIKGHTNRLKPFLPLLKPGSRVLADPEYDVEDNYRIAIWNDIDLQVKQREDKARKSFRKKARKMFSRRKYGKRKLGERFFGNLEVRGHRCYYRKQEHKYKGMLLMGCEHNIRAHFKNKAWAELFTIPFVEPLPLVHRPKCTA
jgi:hypothetical protein